MSEYIRGDEIVPCPKCHSAMIMETDHGSIVLSCPIHGTNWQSDDTELQAPRGRNQYYRIVRRRNNK